MWGARSAWFRRAREGEARQCMLPLTGRVGKACGPICPAHALAQFTTLGAWNDVLVVVTPVARPSDTFTAVTRSPEEKSMPRFFAALMAAAVSPFGSTLRSSR